MSFKIGDAIKIYRNTKMNQFLGIAESKNMFGNPTSFLNTSSVPLTATRNAQAVMSSARTSFVPESAVYSSQQSAVYTIQPTDPLRHLQNYRISSAHE